MPNPVFFPLRWESTREQWWYASPIDWAAANGHYDMVRELLRLDSNHLMKLTSLRRIHRLETVWDDDAQEHFHGVAKCRSQVARKLFLECEKKNGKNSLTHGGYGGWLLYTAASAGDLGFVQELLMRDPLLVFGEGEYGVTDILYAAARSKNCDVFWILFDFAHSPRFSGGNGREPEEHIGDIPLAYKREVLNRALHAAARGGNLSVLRVLLADSCRDVIAFRDNRGATILHSAAARGQVEVVKELVACYDIISSKDNNGNTALHVAAARGQLAVVEALIVASPSLIHSANNAGETFLHSAVTGFQAPCFRRQDRQMKLMEQLVSRNVFEIEEIINSRRNDGRTALHLAIICNIHYKLVESLMSVSSIDVNTRDVNGMTPLDVLRQRPRSESSEILMRRLISAGGIFGEIDSVARRIVSSHLRLQKNGGASPGTSFRIPDPEMLLFTGIENTRDSSGYLITYSADNDDVENHCPRNRNYSTPHTKRFLHLPRFKSRDSERCKKRVTDRNLAANSGNAPIPLRQRFSKDSALPNVKRLLSVRSNAAGKKKSLSRMINGVLETIPWRKNAHVENGRNAGTCAVEAGESRRQDLVHKCLCFRGPAAQPVKAPTGGMEPFRFMNVLFDQQQDHHMNNDK